MPELSALVRLSIARHRWLLFGLSLSVLAGVCVAIGWRIWSPGPSGDQVATVALLVSLLPSGIAAIVLFDYGLEQDLMQHGSGCDHWILRMPIDDWKIAIVPVVLKSAWVSGLWILFVAIARWMGSASIPILMPCIAFSAIGVWILVLSWRPFRHPLTGLAGLVVAAIVLYVALVGAIASPTIKQVEWRVPAIVASGVACVSLYVGGILYLIRSTHLARINPGGIIPTKESSRRLTANTKASPQETPLPTTRIYRNQIHALFWHDFQRSIPWIRKIYLFFVIPTIVLYVLFVPVGAFGIVTALFLFAYWAGMAVSRTLESGEASRGMPVYLAASPLRTKTLAWTRQLFPLAVALVTFSCLLVLFVGWGCWESNRQAWMRWAEVQAKSLDAPNEAFRIGVRLSIAVVLGVGVFALGRIAAFWWVGLTGRPWVSIIVTIVTSLGLLVPFGFALSWFLRQKDWESTQASAYYFLTWLPWLIGTMLIAKAVLALVVGIASWRRGLASASDLLCAFLIWAALTVALAFCFELLLPYRFVTLVWCLAITALVIPMARILVMPLAVSVDRHR
jgi:hypothetical protein